MINVSPTPRHHDNETWPRCPGVSRSQIVLVRQARVTFGVCSVDCNKESLQNMQGLRNVPLHLPVRLPVFSITAAVQEELLCPNVMSVMPLCSYGRYVCCTFQRNLQPMDPPTRWCPAPVAVEPSLGCSTTTGGQGGGVQRGAASCKEVVIQFSALC